jgi:hypothetical protein
MAPQSLPHFLLLKTVVYEKANSLLLDPVCGGVFGDTVPRMLNPVMGVVCWVKEEQERN